MTEKAASSIYAEMNRRLVPYGVSLELTARCNLDCVHCYHVRSDRAELDGDEVVRVLDELAALGTMELTLTGGEPLTRPDFPSILEYAVKTTGFSVKIFSNLILLTPEYADILASFPLNSFETTLLGPDAALHDRLTGHRGSFDATVGAIRMLKERGIRVSAKSIAMRPNIHALGALYDLARSLDIPFRHDDCLFVEWDGTRKPLALQVSDDELVRLRRKSGADIPPRPVICNIGRSVMSIAPDGSVYPCGAFPRAAGNVRDMSLTELWRDSPVMTRIRDLSPGDYTVCRECRYLLRCGGCVAMGAGLSQGRKYHCRLARRRLKDIL